MTLNDAESVKPAGSRKMGWIVGAAAGTVAVAGGVIAWSFWGSDEPGEVAQVAPSASASPSPVVSPSVTAEPSVTPSPSSEPSVTPSPEVETPEPVIIEGFAPVPQRPLEEVPWDEVGPGWFAVDYRDIERPMPGKRLDDGEFDELAYPDLIGSVSLIGPDGAWYAARTYEEMGSGFAVAWDGAHIWMIRDNPERRMGESWGSADAVSVENGDTVGSVEYMEHYQGKSENFATGPGSVFSVGGSGDWYAVNYVAIDGTSLRDCEEWKTVQLAPWNAVAPSFQSDRGGQWLCFLDNEAGGTDVVVMDANGSGDAPPPVVQLPAARANYMVLGWINDHEVFVHQNPSVYDSEAVEHKTYVLNTDTGELTEQDLPFYDVADAAPWSYHPGFYDEESGLHVGIHDQALLSVYDVGGELLHTIDAGCAPSDEPALSPLEVTASGDRILVQCYGENALSMWDLHTGEEIGTWDDESYGYTFYPLETPRGW